MIYCCGVGDGVPKAGVEKRPITLSMTARALIIYNLDYLGVATPADRRGKNAGFQNPGR